MNLFEFITGPISRMSYVNRYSSFPVNRRENVAEHSWWVAFIAYCIGVDLLERGEDIRIDVLTQKAIMHDVSECVSGDIIRSYKHTDAAVTSALQAADILNMETLLRDQGEVGEAIFGGWDRAKEGAEGQVVAFADMAAVAFYCREEDRSGNRAIRPVLKEMYETWFHKFHDHEVLGQYIDAMFPTKRWTDMLREESLPAAKMFPMQPQGAREPVAAHDFEGEGAA